MGLKNTGRRLSAAAIAAAVVLAVAGCNSTAYYQDQAVQRAREFLLENAPELTPLQVAHVRYNKPTLLAENVLGGSRGGWAAISERSQICITWLIPGCRDAYLVYGVSSQRMYDWFPERLIRKTFTPMETVRLSAIGAARNYALENLYFDLSKHEYNQVRFSDPRILRTDFNLNLNPDGKLTEAQLTRLKTQTQFSMIWGEDAEAPTVICGIAAENLAGFQVYFGGKIEADVLHRHTVSTDPPAAPKTDAKKP